MQLLTGPRSASQGSDLYLTCLNTSDQTTDDALHLTLTDFLLPPGVTVHAMSRYNPSGDESCDSFMDAQGQQWVWKGAASTFGLRLRLPADLAPGWHDAVIVSVANGVTTSTPWRFECKPLPASMTAAIASDPFRAKWEQAYLALGQKWADWLAGNPLSFGCESEVWYYDGGRVFLQMAEYFRDPKWLIPAETILTQYAKYVNDSNGAIPGRRMFPWGLLMNWRRTGCTDSLRAIHALYSACDTPYLSDAAPCRGQIVDTYQIRELAYAIDCLVAGGQAGMPRSPWLGVAVDGALGMIDQLFVSAPFAVALHQVFMDGLLAEALIAYADMTEDPRIKPAVETMCNWIWDHAVNRETGAMLYCVTPNEPAGYVTELNNLIAPAFRWAGQEDRYRFLAEHALDTDISYTGKIFSQNFKWQ